MAEAIKGTKIIPKSAKICPTISNYESSGNLIRLDYISRDGDRKIEYVELPDEQQDIILTVQGPTVQGHSKPSWARVYEKSENGKYTYKRKCCVKICK